MPLFLFCFLNLVYILSWKPPFREGKMENVSLLWLHQSMDIKNTSHEGYVWEDGLNRHEDILFLTMTITDGPLIWM